MIKIRKNDSYRTDSGSFRDPSGFVFFQDGSIYRQINTKYKEDYNLLIKSGLYKSLVDSKLMIAHEEVDNKYAKSKEAYKVIKPEIIPFISYPYEWSFSQLKDAALIMLKLQKVALEFGMSLKDCSAYNIQFRKCKPIFIDTLSFEKYVEGMPWVAQYRQFCRHFLATLALMSHKDVRLNQLLRVYIDGIPLDLASKLLPAHTRLRPSFFYHIHLSAKIQKYFVDKSIDRDKFKMSKKALLNLIEKLESAIRGLKWQPSGTEWADYYNITNYSPEAFDHKKKLISEFLEKINSKIVLDLGANIGTFSHIAGDKGMQTISVDNDPAAIERSYLDCIKNKKDNVLPLLLDLINPNSDIGWDNEERMSFFKRNNSDTVMALALIHHLAISNNLPLGRLASFFNKICNYLIIEFIPKNDSQVQKLLSRREDIFKNYTQESFEKEFEKYFNILESQKIKNSERTLYLMKRI